MEYDVSNEVLINSRQGALREYFKIEALVKGVTEMTASKKVALEKLRKLRRIVNDLNLILRKRGIERTNNWNWKSKLKT